MMSQLSTLIDPRLGFFLGITVVACIVAFIAKKFYEPESRYRRRMQRNHSTHP